MNASAINVFAFMSSARYELTKDQLAAVDGLDTGRRGGPEPTDIALETYGRPIPES
jgi:hypothetical protein